jgi:hypothetical protein
VLLKWSIRASQRGWKSLSGFLLELDLVLSGLGGASRRIRKDRARRQSAPRVETVIGSAAS